MLTAADARSLRDEFAARFSSPEAFDASWQRCWETLRKPAEHQARKWLEEDLERDRIVSAGRVPQEPALPVRSSYELSECAHCGGLRYVRAAADLAPSHPDFGRAVPCWACADARHVEGCAACQKRMKSAQKPDEKLAENHRDFVAELAAKMRVPATENGDASGPTPGQLRDAERELVAYRKSPEYLAAIEELRGAGPAEEKR